MCSQPRTGDATDEKIAEKNREKFNELNFLRQNHGLRQRVATQAIFAARWRRDNFQKIASPSQAKNRSCSRGLRDSRYIGKNTVKNCFKARAKMTSDKFDDERLLARKTNENKMKNG